MAAAFRAWDRVATPPVAPPTFVARPKLPEPDQGAMTASQTLRRSQMEQAQQSQSSVGSGYQWAVLNVSAIIGGHTFPAGTRIAVALSQTSTSGGGKAHTTSTVTKVWAKFGQTFDSSSWVEGNISANLFTLTGQTATWSTQNGFGAPHGGHHGGGHGGGHHGGGGHGGGFRFRGGGGRGGWGWGPEILVVHNEAPYCVWREVGALPSYVFAAFAAAVPTTLSDGSTWVQVSAGGGWWAKHTSSGGSAVFYQCDFSGTGFAGLPDGEKAMTMQMTTVGVGAVIGGRFNSGLGRTVGFGIPGPWGDNPSGIAAGSYELTGTQVALRKTAGVSGEEIGRFNQVESSPNIVAGSPDQVDFAGTSAPDATKQADGLTWAFVGVKTGPLAGQKGFVAMKYMGPVGWTASHNGTGPMPQGGTDITTTTTTTTNTEKKTNYIPWIIGGVALVGLVVGGALVGKKGYRRAKAHVRLHRMKSRRRAYA